MTYKVLYLNPLRDYISRLEGATPEGFELTVLPPDAPVADMCREAAEADFLVSGVDIPEVVFRSATRARFIQYMSSGFGQLPLGVLNDLGIPVAQMKTHSISVAEHAVTLMLSVLRRIPASIELLRDGKWRPDLDETSYAELYGKTVGIIGLGNIGRWVGKIVHHGFGANVIYYDNAEIPLTVSELIPATAVSLGELMSRSDIVCVNVPLNAGSNKMVGAPELSRMKSTSILINVGRGEVIDELALTDALREGSIAGAGLDVFAAEPIDPTGELAQFDNVVCTPHMAGVGWENVQRRIATTWNNILTATQGGVPSGVVTDVRRIEMAS